MMRTPVSDRELLVAFATISMAILALALVVGLAVRLFIAVAGI